MLAGFRLVAKRPRPGLPVLLRQDLGPIFAREKASTDMDGLTGRNIIRQWHLDTAESHEEISGSH